MLRLESGVYIYGAGKLATFILSHLQNMGISVKGFIDFKASESPVREVGLIPIDEIERNLPIVISVLNNFVDPGDIAERLASFSFGEIITPPQIFRFFGQNDSAVQWYWLSSKQGTSFPMTTRRFLQKHFDNLSNLTLENIYSYRSDGIYRSNHMLTLDKQYLETGISDFWDGDIYLLDGGAFDGDTVRSLNANRIFPKRTYCFEPDLLNYSRLVSNLKTLKSETIPVLAALGNRCGKSFFNQSSSTASSLQESISEREVITVDADSILKSERISHIKLDLEGGELEALSGMKNIIAENRPKLAISVYHKPTDLEDVLAFVQDFDFYDQFSLRNYAHQGFETIFFAASSKSF